MLTIPLYTGNTRRPETDQILTQWLDTPAFNGIGPSVTFAADSGATATRLLGEVFYWHLDNIVERDSLFHLPKEQRTLALQLAGMLVSDDMIKAQGLAYISCPSLHSKPQLWECLQVREGAILFLSNTPPLFSVDGETLSPQKVYRDLRNSFIAVVNGHESAHTRLEAHTTMSRYVTQIIEGRHEQLMRAMNRGSCLPPLEIAFTNETLNV